MKDVASQLGKLREQIIGQRSAIVFRKLWKAIGTRIHGFPEFEREVRLKSPSIQGADALRGEIRSAIDVEKAIEQFASEMATDSEERATVTAEQLRQYAPAPGAPGGILFGPEIALSQLVAAKDRRLEGDQRLEPSMLVGENSV
jgi:hypothetical protein